MALVYEHNFARVTAVDAGRVELAYDLDRRRWPWLALPAHHPVLVEKYQYFSAVTAGSLGTSPEAGAASALTRFRWSCAPAAWDGRHATTGLCRPRAGEQNLGYELVVRDGDGRLMYRATGEGFRFDDRDFPAWRARNRRAAQAAVAEATIATAPARSVGVEADAQSFVTPLAQQQGAPTTTALVPTAAAFHPAHPFHTGSGDHVNAGHLFDCILQAAHLVLHDRGPLHCTGGDARFLRFVELDVPFSISLRRREQQEQKVTLEFAVSQAGRENALIVFDLRGA